MRIVFLIYKQPADLAGFFISKIQSPWGRFPDVRGAHNTENVFCFTMLCGNKIPLRYRKGVMGSSKLRYFVGFIE